MAAQPCYSGPNPVKDEERYTIWKWAKEHGGVDDGASIDSVGDAINKQFYSGMAKPEWISDILTGRKTPFRQVTTEMWKKQYNRRVIQQQAREMRDMENLGPVGKWMRRIWTVPRTIAVAGHGVVFPVTHAGDLAFRPASWGTFIKGTLRTYRAAPELWGLGSKLGGGKAYAGRMLSTMERDAMFDTAIRSGLDAGAGSHPTGLLSRNYHGPAQRAWDMLTVMRFELWKKQMGKFVKPGMAEADVMDIGKNLAEWANHATGSGKGPIASAQIPGLKESPLFGPKLTQSKLNRIVTDPAQTVKTFSNWKEATAGEKAAAWTRLSGATQFVGANLGFLAVNQGLLYAFGQKEEINYKNPMRGDWMAFKSPGMHGYIPGLHTEVRMLSKLLATAFQTRQELHGEARFSGVAKTLGQYALAKLTPSMQRPIEVGLGQDWMGRPLPWSSEKGTPTLPKMTYGEYLADIGPIPLSGPIGYVYDQFQKQGMSKGDSLATVKALIVHGLTDPKAIAIGVVGLPGVHVREEHPPKPEPAPHGTISQQIRARKAKATRDRKKALQQEP